MRPEQYPDIAALVGETSDNLPGVPKVGEKTAVKWLGQFGSLDALLENADKVTGVVGGNLREHLDDVRRNRTLNRLLRDVELPVTVRTTSKCSRWTPRPCATSSRAWSSRRSSRASPSSPASSSRWPR